MLCESNIVFLSNLCRDLRFIDHGIGSERNRVTGYIATMWWRKQQIQYNANGKTAIHLVINLVVRYHWSCNSFTPWRSECDLKKKKYAIFNFGLWIEIARSAYQNALVWMPWDLPCKHKKYKYVIIALKRRFDVVITCLLRHVFAGLLMINQHWFRLRAVRKQKTICKIR